MTSGVRLLAPTGTASNVCSYETAAACSLRYEVRPLTPMTRTRRAFVSWFRPGKRASEGKGVAVGGLLGRRRQLRFRFELRLCSCPSYVDLSAPRPGSFKSRPSSGSALPATGSVDRRRRNSRVRPSWSMPGRRSVLAACVCRCRLSPPRAADSPAAAWLARAPLSQSSLSRARHSMVCARSVGCRVSSRQLRLSDRPSRAALESGRRRGRQLRQPG
jgi:hypothetical protein